MPVESIELYIEFADLVAAELGDAREKFPTGMRSSHEGFAILYEEVDELWDEVRAKQGDRSPSKMLTELVQVAAMAQRMAEDIVFSGKLDQ